MRQNLNVFSPKFADYLVKTWYLFGHPYREEAIEKSKYLRGESWLFQDTYHILKNRELENVSFTFLAFM